MSDRPHDLVTFFESMQDELGREYARIFSDTADDPGTAGDEGEENWATLLRSILPGHFHVTTKGRILTAEGRKSPQIDVLVLYPEYPSFLIETGKKVYLADGIAAAFECKNTLRAGHLVEAATTAASLRDFASRRAARTPYQALYAGPAYGVLAHSHAWTGDKAQPELNVEKSIQSGIDGASLPDQILDVVCVADLATWAPIKLWGTVPPAEAPAVLAQLSRVQGSGPLLALAATLLTRIAWNYPPLQRVADYFGRVAPYNGTGPARRWQVGDVFSEPLRQEMAKRCDNRSQPWDEWGLILR